MPTGEYGGVRTPRWMPALRHTQSSISIKDNPFLIADRKAKSKAIEPQLNEANAKASRPIRLSDCLPNKQNLTPRSIREAAQAISCHDTKCWAAHTGHHPSRHSIDRAAYPRPISEEGRRCNSTRIGQISSNHVNMLDPLQKEIDDLYHHTEDLSRSQHIIEHLAASLPRQDTEALLRQETSEKLESPGRPHLRSLQNETVLVNPETHSLSIDPFADTAHFAEGHSLRVDSGYNLHNEQRSRLHNLESDSVFTIPLSADKRHHIRDQPLLVTNDRPSVMHNLHQDLVTSKGQVNRQPHSLSTDTAVREPIRASSFAPKSGLMSSPEWVKSHNHQETRGIVKSGIGDSKMAQISRRKQEEPAPKPLAWLQRPLRRVDTSIQGSTKTPETTFGPLQWRQQLRHAGDHPVNTCTANEQSTLPDRPMGLRKPRSPKAEELHRTRACTSCYPETPTTSLTPTPMIQDVRSVNNEAQFNKSIGGGVESLDDEGSRASQVTPCLKQPIPPSTVERASGSALSTGSSPTLMPTNTASLGVGNPRPIIPPNHTCGWHLRFMELTSEVRQLRAELGESETLRESTETEIANLRRNGGIRRHEIRDDNELAIEGLTIVVHMKGKDDLIINTDLAPESVV
jgi:hypothetical protein